jgi:hypothetical protein
MCAERDPLTCHRTILVCRHLRDEFAIEHILSATDFESHIACEQRLLKATGLLQSDLLRTPEERLTEAYTKQGAKMGYALP